MSEFHAPHLAAALLAASSHQGGRAVFWILGWLVLLAVIVGIITYVLRRGRS